MSKTPDVIKKGLEVCNIWMVDEPNHCKECPYFCTKDCADTLMKNALALIQQLEARVPRWIRVEERLPEDDVNVLIYAVSNGDDVDSCIAMTSYTHRMHGFNIEGWRSPWQYFFFDYMITHWMPLPEPPKEE